MILSVKEIQLIILHALLSAGWESEEALIEAERLAWRFSGGEPEER